jgi:hypothetical protein
MAVAETIPLRMMGHACQIKLTQLLHFYASNAWLPDTCKRFTVLSVAFAGYLANSSSHEVDDHTELSPAELRRVRWLGPGSC